MELVTVETVFGTLAFFWFIVYGIGTPWQIGYENPQGRFSWWWKVSQFFAHGAGASAGWAAAYMLWKLWETRMEHFDLSYVILFVIAFLGITGWLPHITVEIGAKTAKKVMT